MIIYIIKSAIILGILYSCYYILLNKETLHRFNRMLLISIMLLSMGLPLVSVTTEHPTAINTEIYDLQSHIAAPVYVGSTRGVEVTVSQQHVVSWGNVLSSIYIIGVAISLLALLLQVVVLVKSMRGGLCHTDERGNTVILKAGNIAPYSFFRYIVMSVEDYEHNRSAILTHEQEHVRLCHSYDLIFLEVVRTLQWFNPFVWFLASNLKAVHEYEADEAVINQGIDAKQYQQLLVTKAVGSRLQPFANNLRRGSLKNRIIMMYQKKSNRWMMLKALFVLPVAALTISAFATPKIVKEIDKTVEEMEKKSVLESVEPKAEAVSPIVEKTPQQTEELSDLMEAEEENDPKPEVFMTVDEYGRVSGITTDSNAKGIRYSFLRDGVFIDGKAITEEQFKNLNSMKGFGFEFGQVGSRVILFLKTQNSEEAIATAKDEDDVFLVCEKNAEYPGGEMKKMEFLMRNLRYPKEAQEVGVSGRINVSFIVEKDGTLSNFKIEGDDANENNGSKNGGAKVVGYDTQSKESAQQKGVTATSKALNNEGQSPDEEKVALAQQALRDEAIRILKAMPKWIPAEQRGNKVRSKASLSVTFRLN